MKIISKNSIFLLFLVLLSMQIYAIGTCSLSKTFPTAYHLQETAVFSCSCTSPIEQNQVGNITWRNSTGSVLYTINVTSGNCQTSLFGSTYRFTQANTTGNVTFEVAGGGAPTNWGDVGDTRFARYNVTDFHVYDCNLIYDGVIETPFDLGGSLSVKAKVKDPVSNEYLLHASCDLSIYDANGIILTHEPYASMHSFRTTTTEGEVVFLNDLASDRFNINTNYIGEFHCHCTNATDDQCYTEQTGQSLAPKSCTGQFLFSTSSIDNRKDYFAGNYSFFAHIGFIGLFMLILMFIMYRTKNAYIKYFSLSFLVMELIIGFGITYAMDLGYKLQYLSVINAIMVSIFGIGFVMLMLWFGMVRTANVTTAFDEKESRRENWDDLD